MHPVQRPVKIADLVLAEDQTLKMHDPAQPENGCYRKTQGNRRTERLAPGV